MKLSACIFFCACAFMVRVAEAFVPMASVRGSLYRVNNYRLSSSSTVSRPSAFFTTTPMPARQVTGRPSSTVTMAGIFGLGAPEIAVCLVVAAVVLGPDKLANVAKDVGKMAGELKDVPAEFQAGIAEGEKRAAESKSLDGPENEVEAKEKTKETA